MKRLLKLADVCQQIGFKKDWIYERLKTGDFPEPIRIDGKSVRWVSTDIDRWIDEQIQANQDAA